MNSNSRDSGSIVLGWLTKLMVVMLLVGVVLFDVVAVGVSRMSAADDANTAAQAASAEWQHSHDVQLAYNAAVQAISNPAERVLVRGFAISTDGSAHLLLRRTTTTLVAYRIGALKKYTTVTAHGEASAPTQ
jgi:flagellar basal body-associated protein FliL